MVLQHWPIYSYKTANKNSHLMNFLIVCLPLLKLCIPCIYLMLCKCIVHVSATKYSTHLLMDSKVMSEIFKGQKCAL